MRPTLGLLAGATAAGLLSGILVGPASAEDPTTLSAVVKDAKYDAPEAVDVKRVTYTYSQDTGTITTVVKVRDLTGKGTLRVAARMKTADGSTYDDRFTITKRRCQVESQGIGPVPCDVLADVTWLGKKDRITVVDHGWEGGGADNRFTQMRMAVSMTEGEDRDVVRSTPLIAD